MEPLIPLSQALDILEQEHGVRLYRNNLTAKTEPGPDGPESVLDRLAREGLARAVERGQRRMWEVAPAAVDRLAETAKSARPGPSPGAQYTLDANQLATFLRHLAGAEDPSRAIRDALAVATGLSGDSLAQVERVVIPTEPRRR